MAKLSKKTDRDDIQNCVNSSPYFRHLVQPQNVPILFPKVIKILASFFEETEYVSVSRSKEEDETDYSKSWQCTVLNCRLVCTSWNKAVEHCYQSPAMSGISEYLQDNPDPLKSRLFSIKTFPWTRTSFNIEDIEKAEKMLAHFEQTHSNANPPKCPFFGRSLILQVYMYWGARGEQRHHYFNLISQLLKLYGCHLWYCDIFISSFCFGSSTELYMKLREWLKRMPNLKTLRILDQGEGQITPISEKRVISRKPLPSLKDLQILELKYLASQIVRELVRRNDHVSVLKLHGIDDKPVEQTSLIRVGNELTNLKEFSVSSSVSGSKMMEEFGSLWKLEKIHLINIPIPASQLFKDILCVNWGDTLSDLFLGDPFSGKNPDTNFEQSKNLRLELPHLKILTLDIGESYFLDFVLPLKNLEYLEAKLLNPERYPGAYRDKVREQQTIEWVGFKEKMEMSNIWKHFGKLNTVVIEYSSYPYTITVYPREGVRMVLLEKSRWAMNQF